MPPLGHRVPYQDVAVQAVAHVAIVGAGFGNPVVVVGGAHFVRITVL